MKKLFQQALLVSCLVSPALVACTSTTQAQEKATTVVETVPEDKTPKTNAKPDERIKHIDATFMRENIFDYKENPTKFVFKGTRPAILDFYADWCPPCKRLSPKLGKLADKYADQIDVYKINVDNEEELARIFGVKSIPMLLFIPMEGTPIQTLGDLTEEQLEQSVAKILPKN